MRGTDAGAVAGPKPQITTMRELAITFLFVLAGLVLLALSVNTVNYRITARSLVITWLGLPVRWVRLSNIKQITSQRVFWAEKWVNSFSPGNRYLLIQKRSGLIKNLVITPKNHFVFKADLERARNLVVSAPAG
jgi:hypothetical protein